MRLLTRKLDASSFQLGTVNVTKGPTYVMLSMRTVSSCSKTFTVLLWQIPKDRSPMNRVYLTHPLFGNHVEMQQIPKLSTPIFWSKVSVSIFLAG